VIHIRPASLGESSCPEKSRAKKSRRVVALLGDTTVFGKVRTMIDFGGILDSVVTAMSDLIVGHLVQWITGLFSGLFG